MIIKLKTVRVYFEKFGITATASLTLFNNAAIFNHVDVDGAIYAKQDPDLEVLGVALLRDKSVIVADIANVKYNPSFIELLLAEPDQVEGQHGLMDMFANKAQPNLQFEEVGRYLKVYIEAWKVNIKASINVVGESYTINWFDLSEGELGAPQDPYFTIPQEVVFMKVGSVITCARRGCLITPQEEAVNA